MELYLLAGAIIGTALIYVAGRAPAPRPVKIRVDRRRR
jgi:hypothetical protein